MEIVSIFEVENPNIGCVIYDEDEEDIFTQLWEKWNDTEYLLDFFTDNKDNLKFWNLTIDEAVNQVLDEVDSISHELLCIVNNEPGFENFNFNLLFEQYHEKEFALRKKGKNFRKAKADFRMPMIRIYAIELEEEGYVITGGCIKLTPQLNQQTKDIIEPQLNRTQDFINDNKIVSLKN